MNICIKVINNRNKILKNNLFHYAHFICDCLFIEIINKFYDYNIVYRQKTLKQTIGNFEKIYEEVMNNKNIELKITDFIKLEYNEIILDKKEYHINIDSFNKFRYYIFERYNINHNLYNTSYPEVLLIKRGKRRQLLNDIDLIKINTSIRTGSERREIVKRNKLQKYLELKYTNKFNSVFLEDKCFEEQVNLFNNAKLIILAHGAALSNMFFCKKGTTIIEITCNMIWPFFDNISSILELNHIKVNNNIKSIISNLPAQ
jgi:hypothetical protein